MRLFKQTPEDYYNAPYAEFPALIRGTVAVVMGILWVFSKLMWRWKVEDSDLLFERQEGRGSVVICNHTSMAELLAVETALFFGGRRIRPIFKSEFAKSKIVRWAFSRVGGIPVERGTADMKCLRAAQHALQRGEDVLIFPEGTRIRSREIKPEVHGGFALIAQMGKAPVNPLAICGWSDITPAGKKIMRPKKCWIRAGKLISLSDAPVELKRKERLAWFESEAMSRVYAMRDDLCAEHPAGSSHGRGSHEHRRGCARQGRRPHYRNRCPRRHLLRRTACARYGAGRCAAGRGVHSGPYLGSAHP